MSKVLAVAFLFLIASEGFSQSRCSDLFLSKPASVSVISDAFVSTKTRIGVMFRKLTSPKTLVAYKVQIPPEMMSELRDAQEVFLRSQAAKEQMHSGETMPIELAINGTRYDVISILGVGGEGEVFLVSSMGEKYVIKKFHSPDLVKENFDLAKKLKKQGANILMPLAYEEKTSMALYPYVDGFDMSFVLKRNLKWTLKLPISDSTIEYLDSLYSGFLRELSFYKKTHPYQQDLIPDNVVLDLRNNQFIIVDPR